MNENDHERNVTCIECQTGQMHHRLVTYITWIGNDMITVPDFPAWTCDFCGRSFYDMKALTRLSLLLNPEANSHNNNSLRTIVKDDNNQESRSTGLFK